MLKRIRKFILYGIFPTGIYVKSFPKRVCKGTLTEYFPTKNGSITYLPLSPQYISEDMITRYKKEEKRNKKTII